MLEATGQEEGTRARAPSPPVPPHPRAGASGGAPAAPRAGPVLISPTGGAGSARSWTAKCVWQGTAWPPHRGARGRLRSPGSRRQPPATAPRAGQRQARKTRAAGDAKQRLQPRPCWGCPLAFGLAGGFTGQRCERGAGGAPRVPRLSSGKQRSGTSPLPGESRRGGRSFTEIENLGLAEMKWISVRANW